MKQVSIALNVIFITVFLYAFCKSHEFSNKTNPVLSSNTPCLTCNGPFQGMTADKFVGDIERYKKTHWDLINKDASNRQDPTKQLYNMIVGRAGGNLLLGFNDSRCIWFSLDTIKKFICYIDSYSSKLGIPPDSLGLRFYYAVYPYESNTFNKAAELREGQHTLFMVPTYQKYEQTTNSSETVDFDPLFNVQQERQINKNGLIDIPYFLNRALNKPTNLYNLQQSFMILNGGQPANTPGNYYAWNNGKLCPTNCPSIQNNTLETIDAGNTQGKGYRDHN